MKKCILTVLCLIAICSIANAQGSNHAVQIHSLLANEEICLAATVPISASFKNRDIVPRTIILQFEIRNIVSNIVPYLERDTLKDVPAGTIIDTTFPLYISSGIIFETGNNDCNTSSPSWVCTEPTVPSFTCHAVFPTSIKSKNQLSIQAEVYDTCLHLRDWLSASSYYTDTAFWSMAYDSMRTYVQLCANKNFLSYSAFGHIDDAVQLMSSDTNRYEKYRQWLISVLYLAPNYPAYFCSCMGSIMRSFFYGKYKNTGYLAVEKYIFSHHSECYGKGVNIDSLYALDSIRITKLGYKTDPSSLPPFDSLGLGTVLQHDKAGVNSAPSFYKELSIEEYRSSPNPFKNETTLEFVLNRMTYTTVAVYDELGRLVWGDGRGSSLEAGIHTIHLDGKNLPSGTLYARISTGFCEVKTVKLIHE